MPLDPHLLATTLPGVVAANAWLVRWTDAGHAFTAFTDGRVLVQGAGDPMLARSLVDRYLG